MENYNDKIKKKIDQYEYELDATAWDVDLNWKQFNDKQELPTRLVLRKRLATLAIAASIMLCVGLSWWLASAESKLMAQSDTEVLEVQLNEHIHATLNKHSKVILKGDKITIEGEVYLSVEEVKEVYTLQIGNLTTELSGNEIAVSTVAGEFSVSVLKGMIQVNQEQGLSMLVNTDYTCQINPTYNVLMVSAIGDRNFLAWKTGELSFDDTPLLTVAAVLEEYYNVKITIDDERAKACFVAISLKQNTPEEAVMELAKLLRVNAIKENGNFVLSGFGC